jgi:photosystem II stability/assembly factor-like uncharacterized protein
VSGTSVHLIEVHALSPRSAFAVGALGTVLSTNDGGATWTRHNLVWHKLIPNVIRETGYVEPNLNTIYFTDSNNGWLGGEFGTILQTRDAGKSWNSRRSGSALPQIAAIRFRDLSNGWAVGQSGTLLKTADAGQSWKEISLAGQPNLFGISLERTKGVVVGERIVLRTVNAGVNWTPAELNTHKFWFSGVAIDGGSALAVGNSGSIQTIALDAADTRGQASRAKSP